MALFTKNAKNEWVITELPEGAGAGDRIEVTTPDGRTVRVRIHLLVTKGDGSRYATARGAAMLAVGTKKAPKTVAVGTGARTVSTSRAAAPSTSALRSTRKI